MGGSDRAAAWCSSPRRTGSWSSCRWCSASIAWRKSFTSFDDGRWTMDEARFVHRLLSFVFGLPLRAHQCLHRFDVAIGDLLNRIGVEQIGFVCQRSVLDL